MTAPIPLMVELCAGTAALSLRLHRAGAKPPVSRIGAKTGYADVILRVLGLIPGQRAAAYLWCEPDPGVRLLLHAYRDAALARAAAAIIRSWATEDPRALWERLRAEGPPRLPEGGVDASPTDLPATIAPDSRAIDPREVAREVITGRWAYRRGVPESGFAESLTCTAGRGYGDTADGMAARWAQAPTLPATIHPDARAVEPHALPPGTVAYMDPPYVGTTSYAHDLPRAEVVALARRWADTGAMVAISEAEPIAELVAEGWYAVRIDGERVGQKRTFSKQQAEWLTLSHPPAWVPSVQGALFGGGR